VPKALRAVVAKTFREHAAAREEIVGVLSKRGAADIAAAP